VILFSLQICTALVVMPMDGLHQGAGMHSQNDDIKEDINEKWEHSDVILMSIDNCEEDWSRLHDIRINGQV